MANPQKENGYTAISNEIIEHLIQIHLSPNQWQVILCILRKTYGYNKKIDYIANFQISEATGLHKSHVSRALCLLEMMNLITRKGKYIGIQKDWERWRKLSKLVTNEKLPETATLNTELPKQVTEQKLPILQPKLPITATKVTSPLVTQKKKETIQKKVVESLEDYTDRVLRPRFLRLNFEVERQKFDTYWSESNRKLQRPKSAFTNWCERADGYRVRDEAKTPPAKPAERLIKDQIKELEDRGVKF